MKSFLAGGVVATVGATVARPLLVGVVRIGYEAVDAVTGVWTKAKAEVDAMNTEARAGRSDGAEVERLRAEVATLKAQAAKK